MPDRVPPQLPWVAFVRGTQGGPVAEAIVGLSRSLQGAHMGISHREAGVLG